MGNTAHDNSPITVGILKKGLTELQKQRTTSEYERHGYTIGRILTVTDGMIADPEQRKAVKDLIHSAYYGNSGPSLGIDRSPEQYLFKALTGDELYAVEAATTPSYDEYNPFSEVLNSK